MVIQTEKQILIDDLDKRPPFGKYAISSGLLHFHK